MCNIYVICVYMRLDSRSGARLAGRLACRPACLLWPADGQKDGLRKVRKGRARFAGRPRLCYVYLMFMSVQADAFVLSTHADIHHDMRSLIIV